MIVRVIKMTVKEQYIDSFRKRVPVISNEVRRVSGCMHNDIFRDRNNDNIFYSYTIWSSEEDIERYLKSMYYKEIWGDIWDYFKKEPMAWKIDNMFDYPSGENFPPK